MTPRPRRHLFLAVVGTGLFGLLALLVSAGSAVVRLDRWVSDGCFHFTMDRPGVHQLFNAITDLGDGRFLNWVCEEWRNGRNRYSKPMTTLFHTSHPGLCAALRRDKKWRQVSANLYGGNKRRSAASILKSRGGTGTGYGGHFRAVQGFRYYGEQAA